MNNLHTIQETILRGLARLDDNELMKSNGASEVARSNAISQSATAYLKTVNIAIRVKEIASKQNIAEETLKKEMGIISDDTTRR